MTFPLASVRAAYPALADGYAYLDGAAGTQVPQPVIDAIAGAYRQGIGNVGGAFPASHRSDAIVAGCRAAVADLVGGHPDGVVLGPNMTTLTYRLAGALAKEWGGRATRWCCRGSTTTPTCGRGCTPGRRCGGRRWTRSPGSCRWSSTRT
ncbi:aminotransferase class V-fold PLP-dependent enzyme [Nonomuraea ferruginea]